MSMLFFLPWFRALNFGTRPFQSDSSSILFKKAQKGLPGRLLAQSVKKVSTKSTRKKSQITLLTLWVGRSGKTFLRPFGDFGSGVWRLQVYGECNRKICLYFVHPHSSPPLICRNGTRFGGCIAMIVWGLQIILTKWFSFSLTTPTPPPIPANPPAVPPHRAWFRPNFGSVSAPFRVCFGSVSGCSVGLGRRASAREKNINILLKPKWLHN